jgi:hypothetical protein
MKHRIKLMTGIRKKISLIVFVLFIVTNSLKAQEMIENDNYVIIRYEVKYSGVQTIENYYWVTPIDSMHGKQIFEIYPLYIDEYSKDNYEKCLKGDTIDIFNTTEGTTYDFDEEYLVQLKSLRTLIKSKEILLQKQELVWNSKTKNKQKLRIYMTPIIGKLCNCCLFIDDKKGSKLNFKSPVFIPVGGFKYDKDFELSELYKIVLITDLSRVDFSSHFPVDIYGRFVSKARIK